MNLCFVVHFIIISIKFQDSCQNVSIPVSKSVPALSPTEMHPSKLSHTEAKSVRHTGLPILVIMAFSFTHIHTHTHTHRVTARLRGPDTWCCWPPVVWLDHWSTSAHQTLWLFALHPPCKRSHCSKISLPRRKAQRPQTNAWSKSRSALLTFPVNHFYHRTSDINKRSLFWLSDKVKPLICCKLSQHAVHNLSRLRSLPRKQPNSMILHSYLIHRAAWTRQTALA